MQKIKPQAKETNKLVADSALVAMAPWARVWTVVIRKSKLSVEIVQVPNECIDHSSLLVGQPFETVHQRVPHIFHHLLCDDALGNCK